MVDAPEVVRDVGVQHVVTALRTHLPQTLQRLRGRALGAEAVRARTKVRLEDRLQHQLRRHLDDPVTDRRDAERAHAPVRLRDVPAKDRLRPIPARAQLGLEGLQKVADAGPHDRVDRLAVHAGDTLVALHPLPRFPQDVTPVDTVVQRVETAPRRPLGSGPQSALEVAHFVSSHPRLGGVGPGLRPAMPSHVAPHPTCPKQGPFAPRAFCSARIGTTTIPSDSRSARCTFTLWLMRIARRDDGCEDGPLVFRDFPSVRAVPHTPPGPDARFGTSASGIVFAVT